jgi:hypothetical protein
MKHATAVLQAIALALALLRGLGEFTALQRWRLRTWMMRRAG